MSESGARFDWGRDKVYDLGRARCEGGRTWLYWGRGQVRLGAEPDRIVGETRYTIGGGTRYDLRRNQVRLGRNHVRVGAGTCAIGGDTRCDWRRNQMQFMRNKVRVGAMSGVIGCGTRCYCGRDQMRLEAEPCASGAGPGVIGGGARCDWGRG